MSIIEGCGDCTCTSLLLSFLSVTCLLGCENFWQSCKSCYLVIIVRSVKYVDHSMIKFVLKKYTTYYTLYIYTYRVSYQYTDESIFGHLYLQNYNCVASHFCIIYMSLCVLFAYQTAGWNHKLCKSYGLKLNTSENACLRKVYSVYVH